MCRTVKTMIWNCMVIVFTNFIRFLEISCPQCTIYSDKPQNYTSSCLFCFLDMWHPKGECLGQIQYRSWPYSNVSVCVFRAISPGERCHETFLCRDPLWGVGSMPAQSVVSTHTFTNLWKMKKSLGTKLWSAEMRWCPILSHPLQFHSISRDVHTFDHNIK